MVAERLAPGPRQRGRQAPRKLIAASWKSLWKFIGSGATEVVEQIELADGEKPLPDRGSGLDKHCVRSRPGLAVGASKQT